MNQFGLNSRNNLLTCALPLQMVLNSAIQHFDFSVICGHRTAAKQSEAFTRGLSKVQWPNSKHNSSPSQAVDIYPWHPKYKSLTEDPVCISRIVDLSGCSSTQALEFIRQEYCMLAQTMKIAASLHNVQLRWGGDWDSDLDRLDQTFNDLAHFELVD